MRPVRRCIYSGHERLNEIGIDFFGGPNSVDFDKKHLNTKVGFRSINAVMVKPPTNVCPFKIPVSLKQLQIGLVLYENRPTVPVPTELLIRFGVPDKPAASPLAPSRGQFSMLY